MKKIALTGGIGSGKSTVAKLFAELGVKVIDADVIAHELVEPTTYAFNKIIDHFGSECLADDGTLDRQRLRDLIFANPDERHWLESLLHPLIHDEMKRQADAIMAPYCLLVIPLLAEVGRYPWLNRVIVVDAPEATQIERIHDRDKLSKAQIATILQSQASREQRLALADDVIVNDGDLANLKKQVAELHNGFKTHAS